MTTDSRGVFSDTKLLEDILEAALLGLETFTARRSLDEPAKFRLAFRDLGLSIGLKSATYLSERLVENSALFGQNSVLDYGVEGTPVTNDSGHLVGYISRGDILRAVVKEPPLSLWR